VSAAFRKQNKVIFLFFGFSWMNRVAAFFRTGFYQQLHQAGRGLLLLALGTNFWLQFTTASAFSL